MKRDMEKEFAKKVIKENEAEKVIKLQIKEE